MKKFITPVSVGGLPIRNEDLTDLLQNQLFGINESYYESIQALTPQEVGIGTGIIIKSLDIVPGGNDNNYTINNVDSLVFIGGEFLRASATQSQISFTQSVYIVPDTTITETRAFADGQVRNATEEKKFRFQTGMPSGLNYIRIQPSLGPIRRVENLLFNIMSPVGEIKLVGSQAVLNEFSLGTGLGSGKYRGWALCDGRNGTIDMRSRVPMGLNAQGAVSVPVSNPSPSQNNTGALGNIGGTQSYTLTEAQLPVISRNVDATIINTPARVRIVNVAGGSDFNVIAGNTVSGTNFLFNDPSASQVSTPLSLGGNSLIDNRMPYITVGYIQKIS